MTAPIVTQATTPVVTMPIALEFARFTNVPKVAQLLKLSEKVGDAQVSRLRTENGVVIVDDKLNKPVCQKLETKKFWSRGMTKPF